jgi:hypothetical protein
MRGRHLLFLALLSAPLLVVCSVGGSGPIPPPPSDFATGATIPGWVLTSPQAGRADVAAASTHAAGRWSVIFSRPLRTRPRDLRFSIAVMDDALAHAGTRLIR